jgi:nicotinate phosphoribosyltransferase
MAGPPGSTALLTDLYELTMAAAYLDSDLHRREATFSLFVRNLPPGRSYLVAGGLAEVIDGLDRFRFGPAELEALRRLAVLDGTTLDHLARLRFDGTVRAVPEGRLVFADEPLLEITAPLPVAQLIETYVLNQVTTQTTLTTKAARMRAAADGRSVTDFSLRRCQGADAGLKAARAAGVVGFAGTSNVAAADLYGIPVSGTMAHSFVQAHGDELDAFRRFARLFGDRTVLLIDTYDTEIGLDRAITVAGELRDRGQRLRGVRIDSGDLADLAVRARRRLDEAGFDDALVLVSGGLDEEAMAELARRAPDAIAGFGVGSSLGVSSDAPVLDSVYKLVELDGRPVRKTSTGKETWPGPKQVWRLPDGRGDLLTTAGDSSPVEGAEPLMVTVLDQGRPTTAGPPSDPAGAVAAANRWFEHDWATLPAEIRGLDAAPRYPVMVSDALQRLTDAVDELRSVSAASDSSPDAGATALDDAGPPGAADGPSPGRAAALSGRPTYRRTS